MKFYIGEGEAAKGHLALLVNPNCFNFDDDHTDVNRQPVKNVVNVTEMASQNQLSLENNLYVFLSNCLAENNLIGEHVIGSYFGITNRLIEYLKFQQGKFAEILDQLHDPDSWIGFICSDSKMLDHEHIVQLDQTFEDNDKLISKLIELRKQCIEFNDNHSDEKHLPLVWYKK